MLNRRTWLWAYSEERNKKIFAGLPAWELRDRLYRFVVAPIVVDSGMDLNDDKYKELVVEAQYQSSLYRGQLLNQVAMLEVMIDGFIAYHFCKKDRFGDFLTIILPSNIIVFENKRAIFKKIVEKFYSEFKNANPKYHKTLEDIRDYRNKFAHYPLDITLPGIIKFEKTKDIVLVDNTKSSVDFKVAEIIAIIEKIRHITAEIVKYTPSWHAPPYR